MTAIIDLMQLKGEGDVPEGLGRTPEIFSTNQRTGKHGELRPADLYENTNKIYPWMNGTRSGRVPNKPVTGLVT
jgi:hypothetical protein